MATKPFNSEKLKKNLKAKVKAYVVSEFGDADVDAGKVFEWAYKLSKQW